MRKRKMPAAAQTTRDLLMQIDQKVTDLTESVNSHVIEDHRIFYGDNNGEKGLLFEHARLMRAWRLWTWIFGTVAGALAMAAAEVIVGGKADFLRALVGG